MVSLIGLGGAGSKVVATFYRKDPFDLLLHKFSRGESPVKGVAIDTSNHIMKLNNIPVENRVLIGNSRVKGRGTGGDAELGKKIMVEESELALAAVKKANPEKPELFFVVASAAGGTGAGGLPVIADILKRVYDVPVVGIVILPSKSEGTIFTKNAYRNFDAMTKALDGTIVLDNGVMAGRGEDLASGHRAVNETLFGFFSMVETTEIYRLTKGKLSTIGFWRAGGQRISLKDLMEKVLRDQLLFPSWKGMDGMHLFVYGNSRYLFGQDFAKEWAEREFKAPFHYTHKEGLSKYLNTGLMITGLGDIKEKVVAAPEEKKESSELEKLLGDIKPL